MTKIESPRAIQIMCSNLDSLKKAFAAAKQTAQAPLQVFVTNKEYPLDDRFEVWSEWCIKKYHPWIIHEADVPFFGKLVDDEVIFDPDRGTEFDWLYFLELFSEDTNEARELCEQYSVTPDEVKELLIEINFGSFRMDW